MKSASEKRDGESEGHIPIYFCNPDFDYAGEYHYPRFTTGAFRVCVEALYQVEIVILLKLNISFYLYHFLSSVQQERH